MPLHALNGDPFDALGDPNRRAILEVLRGGDRSVSELTGALGNRITRPAVSRHLRLLKQAGLVTDRAEGTRRLYRLDDAGIEAVREYLEQVWGEAATRFRLLAENTSDRTGRSLTEPIEPIEIKFEVACSPQHAFDTWANKTSLWWPPSHSMTSAPGLVVTFESHPGGRIFERTPDGAEHDWGEVVAWEPPHRLAYLWHLGTDRGRATEVDISFAGDDTTTVTIVHRGWERLGADGPAWRQRNLGGWDGLLPHYREAVSARTR